MKGVCYASWRGDRPHLLLPPGWSSFALHNFGELAEPIVPTISRGALAGKGGETGHVFDWEFGGPTLSKWAGLLKKYWTPDVKGPMVALGVDTGIVNRVKSVGQTSNALRRSLPPDSKPEYAGYGLDLYPRRTYRTPARHMAWADFRVQRLTEFREAPKSRPWAFVDVHDQWPDHGLDPSGDELVVRPEEQVRMQIAAVPFGVGIILFASARTAKARKRVEPAIIRACGWVDEMRGMP